MRGLILALQFLTRLPTPAVKSYSAESQARSVVWFPLVGLLLGLLVTGSVWLGARIDPWLGALLGLVAWVGLTGALHLDGLADLADALGASHGRPDRLLAVLEDVHLGVFGGAVLILQMLAKLVLLMLVAKFEVYGVLLLAPAWARWGVFWWSRLPSIKPGLGERFSWRAPSWLPWLWLAGLAWASQGDWGLLAAPLLVLAWHAYLRLRLGGMTGDALGAGVELTESALLLVGLLVHHAV